MKLSKRKALPEAIQAQNAAHSTVLRGPAALTVGACFMAAASFSAQAQSDDENSVRELDTLSVTGFRGEAVDSIKYQRNLQETPRIITVLPSDLLEEQNVTELRDALRNVSGVSLQAGEGNPPGGDQLKIRGFNARDDINVDGSRDLGNYFRDPFYVQQIEVIKGPNSSFSGRGSAGGTINFVTKKPMMEDRNRVELSVGTDELLRTTADLNRRIDGNSAVRFNMMTNSENAPGRDEVNSERHGFFGSYVWGLQGDTQVEVDYLHTRQNNLEDKGLPFDRAGFTGDTADLTENGGERTPGGQRAPDGYYTGELPPGIDYSNFYGHKDDYQDIDVDQLGLAVEHSFNSDLALRNQLRVSRVLNDSITSSPRLVVPEDAWGTGDWSQVQVRGDLKPRDQKDMSYFNTTDLLVSFDTGGLEHDLVLGAELGYVDIENKRRPDVKGTPKALYDPEILVRPAAPYDGSRHRLESEQFGVYALDTIALSPQWDLHGGVRWDYVKSTATDYGYVDPIGPVSRTDREVSGNLGLVYKPTQNASFYASVGSAFDVTGTFDRGLVQLAGGGSAVGGGREDIIDEDAFNTDPEKTIAYELGAKVSVADNLLVSAAIFRTDKTNARTPAIGQGDQLDVLDGEQRVEGFEIGASGSITPDWELYTSYTFLDSEVIKSNNPWEEGSRLGGTPEHTFNAWTTYDLSAQWSVGGGMEYVDDQVYNANAKPGGRRRQIEIDSYSVFHASTTYRFNQDLQVRLNAFNLADKEYISQAAEGGAQGIPGPGRHLIATMRYDF
ncbi:TonB-dependent siderophore receptor [Marinobacter sp. ATCH36]|uniref:TonB-dependent receptor n=1 Tax=Marinobacter sp. ATCH36 TaxID=2945106 RepID=UPI002020F31B|nr:TonB-dependent siderophore receptor [Marinobacter sp. ATCH36]MCL7943265.1 TonB-dependent siderophore receptor [Marinobacter sp. ATCH36]